MRNPAAHFAGLAAERFFPHNLLAFGGLMPPQPRLGFTGGH